MMDYKRALTENLGAKIFALMVALIIWFSASSQQQMTRLFSLPLKIVNMPDSLTILGKPPAEVETNVTATKRQLLYLGFKKGFVQLDISEATPGRYRQNLSPANVVLPARIDPNNIRIISPTSVDLFFEKLIRRKVPVGLTLSGSLSDEYLFNEPPRIEPGFVEVTGGESQVRHLKSIPTRPVELNKVKESSDKEIEIDFAPGVLRCKPDRVRVFLSISRKAQRTLINLPPTILLDNPKLQAEVEPKTVALTLEGPQAMLDTLSSGDVSILLDLSGKRIGSYSIAPEIIVPDGVERFSISVESLRVRISVNKKSK